VQRVRVSHPLHTRVRHPGVDTRVQQCRQLIKQLDDAIYVPSRDTLVRAIHTAADEQKEKVRARARTHCSLPTPLVQIKTELHGKDVVVIYNRWSDRFSKRSYLDIVVRFIDMSEKIFKQSILAVSELEHPHTFDRVRACVLDVLRSYDVDADKQLVKLCADNGSNLRKSLGLG